MAVAVIVTSMIMSMPVMRVSKGSETHNIHKEAENTDN